MLADAAGNPLDLMEGPGHRAEIELVLGCDLALRNKTLRPLQVAEVAVYGPAAQSRRIQPGDDLLRLFPAPSETAAQITKQSQ